MDDDDGGPIVRQPRWSPLPEPSAHALDVRASLSAIGMPAPWRLSEDDFGVVLAENGEEACVVDSNGQLDDDTATHRAGLIMTFINVLAGYRPDTDDGVLQHPLGRA